MHIDLNCDLGEGSPFDGEVMPLITTANVACGQHAGDPQTMLATLELARRHNVRVGAHPSYPDREHFGRREMRLSPVETFSHCVAQIGALAGIARFCGLTLSHVKPHGGLYNMAFADRDIAEAVVNAAQVFSLPVMGLPGSELERLAQDQFIREGFADRRYRPDGSLVPRTEPDAFVTSSVDAVAQVRWLIRERGIQSVCVHGDNPDAVGFIQALRLALREDGIDVWPFA